jgi:hypothetical protein
MADTTHVGWKTEPVRDDCEKVSNGGRVQGRTGGLGAEGQGRPVCLSDQIDAAPTLTDLFQHDGGPSHSDRLAESNRRKRRFRPLFHDTTGREGQS